MNACCWPISNVLYIKCKRCFASTFLFRAKLEKTLRFLEEGGMRKISGTAKSQAKFEKYESKSDVKTYQPAADSTIPVKSEGEEEEKKKKKKRKVGLTGPDRA